MTATAPLDRLRLQVEAETAALIAHYKWFADPNRAPVKQDAADQIHRHRLQRLRDAWRDLRTAMQQEYGHP